MLAFLLTLGRAPRKPKARAGVDPGWSGQGSDRLKRLARDPGFREALSRESVETMLQGDMDTGKAVLRDDIKATVDFRDLDAKVGAPPKSLIRMCGPKGNPRADNLFRVLSYLQKEAGSALGVELEPEAAPRVLASPSFEAADPSP